MSDVAHALACRGELQFAVWPWAEAHGSTLKRAPRRRSGGVGRNPEPNTWHPRPQGAFTRAAEPAPGRSAPPARAETAPAKKTHQKQATRRPQQPTNTRRAANKSVFSDGMYVPYLAV